MKLKPFSITLIIAAILSIMTAVMLAALKEITAGEIIIVVLILFFITSIIVYIILDFLIFRNINKWISIINNAKSDRNAISKFYKFQDLASELDTVLSEKDKSIEELKMLAAFRKEFIADVSHELKTPIFAAQGFVQGTI